MITVGRINAMRILQENLAIEGKLSRSECVKELLDNLEQARLLLMECKGVFGEIHKKAENGFIDEVLLYSGALEAKLSKTLDVE